MTANPAVLSSLNIVGMSHPLQSAAPEALIWRADATVMALVGLAHAMSHFSHLLLPGLFPFLQRDFGLSFSELGGLMTLFFTVSGLGQALSGFVVDRTGARPVLFGSILLFMGAALSAALAQGYAGLMLSALLAGLGNAPFHPVDFSILNQRVSAPRLGHAYSVHGLSGNLGWALSTAFLVGVAASSNWRLACLGALLLYALVLALLVWQRQHLATVAAAPRPVAAGRQGAQGGAGAPAAEGEFDFLRLPVVWWCFAFFLLTTMTLAVVHTFSVSILRALHGVSLQAASLTLTAYMLCGAAGMLAGGFVAARARRSEQVVALCMSGGALLLLLCASGWLGTTGTMVALAATGVAVGIGGPSRDMMIKRATPAGATGRIYGTVYSGLDAGLALSPLLFGTLMDRGHYQATLAGAGLVLLLAVLVALGVGRRTVARA
ncbi:MFS transporter [Malikia spinosa]|uniref:MFS transporter n=1 Tax=Malikia spinosa TaxID=86180 RepID=A0A2S9KBF1_9BURK|nr:MFS transporter [Malikia spinosa]PRD67771.1 MFS transporter [Malikia spinosa]